MGELSTVQLIFIGIGILIAVPALLDMFKGLSIPSLNSSAKKAKLSSTVVQWEALYNSCKDLCLMDACKKLDETFPLLVERDKNCLQKEDEIEILND